LNAVIAIKRRASDGVGFAWQFSTRTSITPMSASIWTIDAGFARFRKVLDVRLPVLLSVSPSRRRLIVR
jgi:hypothetical protein